MQTHKKNDTRKKAIDDKMLELADNDFKEDIITKTLLENIILNTVTTEKISAEK